MFIGREKELNELESRYAEDIPQLIVVYGKRRLGKTALLKEFAKDKTHFFYVSRETIDSEQIKLFSKLAMVPLFGFLQNGEMALQLFLGGHAASGGLLAVSQRCVKNTNFPQGYSPF